MKYWFFMAAFLMGAECFAGGVVSSDDLNSCFTTFPKMHWAVAVATDSQVSGFPKSGRIKISTDQMPEFMACQDLLLQNAAGKKEKAFIKERLNSIFIP